MFVMLGGLQRIDYPGVLKHPFTLSAQDLPRMSNFLTNIIVYECAGQYSWLSRATGSIDLILVCQPKFFSLNTKLHCLVSPRLQQLFHGVGPFTYKLWKLETPCPTPSGCRRKPGPRGALSLIILTSEKHPHWLCHLQNRFSMVHEHPVVPSPRLFSPPTSTPQQGHSFGHK